MIAELENEVGTVDTTPSVNVKLTLPRLVAPSCNCSVAVISDAQAPLTRNVNGFATDAPPAANAPYVCAPEGDRIRSLASKVASRLLVSAVPMFLSAKLTVTSSPGSITPFDGLHPSVANTKPSPAITAAASDRPVSKNVTATQQIRMR